MTREVQIAGIIPEPDGPWMGQMARNLTDATDGFLCGCRYLIQDRSTLFTSQFREILKCAGVESIRLPVCSPNLNAFAERFVRSIKESCLDRQIFFGERALREAVTEFVAHDHSERNHQGLDNKIIQANFTPFHQNAPIKCRSLLGGQLNDYYREAV